MLLFPKVLPPRWYLTALTLAAFPVGFSATSRGALIPSHLLLNHLCSFHVNQSSCTHKTRQMPLYAIKKSQTTTHSSVSGFLPALLSGDGGADLHLPLAALTGKRVQRLALAGGSGTGGWNVGCWHKYIAKERV